jgi:hypothetical protein
MKNKKIKENKINKKRSNNKRWELKNKEDRLNN